MPVATLEMKVTHPSRDCKSYLIWDAASGEAALLDPRFDLVREYVDQLKELGLTLRYAVDSHTHADHLSGSDRMRNLTGCKVVMSDRTRSRVPDLKVADGHQLPLGDQHVTCLHTPGHTPDSMCLFDGARIYTGDTLFIGGAARTDFMGGDSGQLFDSFRRIEALGPAVEVWPGHDYNRKQHSTVEAELRNNPHFGDTNRDSFVRRMDIKGQLPANMAEILSFNTEAGLPEDRIIRPEQVARLGRPGRDFTLLDVRYADEWAAGRAEGAVHIPMPELRARWAEVAKLPRPVVSICRSGIRATLMMMTARHAGDQNWLLLEGGMNAWQQAGLPLVADAGRKPDIVASATQGGGSCALPTCASG